MIFLSFALSPRCLWSFFFTSEKGVVHRCIAWQLWVSFGPWNLKLNIPGHMLFLLVQCICPLMRHRPEGTSSMNRLKINNKNNPQQARGGGGKGGLWMLYSEGKHSPSIWKLSRSLSNTRQSPFEVNEIASLLNSDFLTLYRSYQLWKRVGESLRHNLPMPFSRMRT